MADVLTESDGELPKRELTPVQKLRYPEAAHSNRLEMLATMKWAADRIERLERRLEIDPRHLYDGIDCRDETIKGLDREVDRLTTERDQEARLREAAFLDCNEMKHDIERLTAANAELATDNETLLNMISTAIDLLCELDNLAGHYDDITEFRERVAPFIEAALKITQIGGKK